MQILKKKKRRKQKMSKGIKKKVSVKLMPGQAIFAADIEVLQHIAETYMYLSQSSETNEEKQSWISISEDVVKWMNQTYYTGQDDGQEEEW
jgi:hypothetical protein